MKRVLLYVRVSTDEQAKTGNSLSFQETALRRECKRKGHEVLKVFSEDHSAKTFDRPAWKELIKYCRANKKLVDLVLFLRWDRFSRNIMEAYQQMAELNKMNIQVNALDQNFDYDTPESKFSLAINLVSGQVENEKNSIRTTEASRQARLTGAWTGTPPKGYKNHRTVLGKSTLIASEDAALVIEAFKAVAMNQLPLDRIRKQLQVRGFKMAKQSFSNMLRNVAYTGKVLVKAYKDYPATIVTGLHDPLISFDLFNQVQDVLSGKRNTRQTSHVENVSFPLRGHLLCTECNQPLTGAPSKGRNQYYNYYKCQNNCIPSIPAEFANEQFAIYLKSIQIAPEIAELYEMIITDVFKDSEGDRDAAINKLKNQIQQVEMGLQKANDKYFMTGSITDEQYQQATGQMQKQMADLNYQIEQIEATDDNLLKHTKFALPFLTNLHYYFENSDLNVKKFIVGSIFPEKLYFSNNTYRTSKMSEVLELLTNAGKGFSVMTKKQATKNRDLSSMAPPSGLEPETL